MHVVWTTNDGGKNQEHVCRQQRRQKCSASHENRFYLCSLGGVSGTEDTGPGQSRSRFTQMAQRATIWSLLQGERKACEGSQFLQLGLLMVE